MGARSTAHERGLSLFPCVAVAVAGPQTPPPHPGLPWTWHRRGAQQRQRHSLAGRSLLSQALLTPRAGSVGTLHLKGAMSTLWLPKPRMTSAILTGLALLRWPLQFRGRWSSPVYLKGETQNCLCTPFFFAVHPSCLSPTWGPHGSGKSSPRSVEQAPLGAEWE